MTKALVSYVSLSFLTKNLQKCVLTPRKCFRVIVTKPFFITIRTFFFLGTRSLFLQWAKISFEKKILLAKKKKIFSHYIKKTFSWYQKLFLREKAKLESKKLQFQHWREWFFDFEKVKPEIWIRSFWKNRGKKFLRWTARLSLATSSPKCSPPPFWCVYLQVYSPWTRLGGIWRI